MLKTKKKKKEQNATVETVETRSNAKRPWHIDATFKPKTHFSKLKTASLKEDKVGRMRIYFEPRYVHRS